MSCLPKTTTMETIQTNGVEINRRGWWARMWCIHAEDDRVPYVRIDHSTGPGWMATNYNGLVCKACGYIHWEQKEGVVMDKPWSATEQPIMGDGMERILGDLDKMPLRMYQPRPSTRSYPAPPPAKPGFMKTSEERIRERDNGSSYDPFSALLMGAALGSSTEQSCKASEPAPSSDGITSGGGGEYGGGGASGSYGDSGGTSGGSDGGGGGGSGGGD